MYSRVLHCRDYTYLRVRVSICATSTLLIIFLVQIIN